MPADDVPAERQEPKVPAEWMILRENHQYDYSMAALQAQERDREAKREHNRRRQKTFSKRLAGLGIFLLLMTGTAFLMNKESFLLECVKYLAVGGGGGGIGYAIGFRRAISRGGPF